MSGAPSPEWCRDHFDYLAPEVNEHLVATLATMRAQCPVTHSDAHGGYWVATRYEDVLRVAQDWRTYSSEHGVSVPGTSAMVVKAIPEHVDPPLHREYKRVITPWFTPAAVATHEAPTRALVTRLIDEFVEDGECELMASFARPLPGLAFFELVLGAPPDEAAHVNELSMAASTPTNPDRGTAWKAMFDWIVAFLDQRRRRPPRDDVVGAVLGARIEGRPISDDEAIGMVQLLILGGLDTTAGALGSFAVRFCEQPEVPALLRDRPDLVADAVEELLRLDGPFISIARTTTGPTELGGCPIDEGEKVLLSWASANRDEAEFPEPDRFVVDRSANRHLAFGAGPHRCAGSNLARMNLRIAVTELVRRLPELRLLEPAETLPFHSALNRSPLRVPVAFTPGRKEST